MKTIQELRDELTHETKSAGDILAKAKAEDRTVTPEELSTWNEHTERAVTLDDAMEAALATNSLNEKQVENEKRLKEMGNRNSPAIPINRTGQVDKADATVDLDERRLLYSKPIAFSDDTQGHERAYRSGKWIQAVLGGNEMARRWCINHGVESRALSEGVSTAGGVLVPEDLLSAIISLRETYGVARQIANIEPMGTDVMTIPRETNDLTATFTGENTALTESDPTFNNVTLTAKKLGIMTRYSTEVAEDAVINLADKIASKMAMAFAQKEDDSIFNGTGAASFGGAYGIAKRFDDEQAALAGAVQATANTDTFAEIDQQDIINLIGALPGFTIDPVFYCSRMCEAIVFGDLFAAGGGNTIQTLAGPPLKSYLGIPIVTTESMPKVASTLDNRAMILYGSMKQASTIGDRRGIQIATSTERYFDLDQVAIKATERVAIVVHDYGTNSVIGPIVALIGAA